MIMIAWKKAFLFKTEEQAQGKNPRLKGKDLFFFTLVCREGRRPSSIAKFVLNGVNLSAWQGNEKWKKYTPLGYVYKQSV